MGFLVVNDDFWLCLQRIEASAKEIAERFAEFYRAWRPILPDVEAEARHSMPPKKLGGARAGTPGVVRGRWGDYIPAEKLRHSET